jgi:hypothetical protein
LAIISCVICFFCEIDGGGGVEVLGMAVFRTVLDDGAGGRFEMDGVKGFRAIVGLL